MCHLIIHNRRKNEDHRQYCDEITNEKLNFLKLCTALQYETDLAIYFFQPLLKEFHADQPFSQLEFGIILMLLLRDVLRQQIFVNASIIHCSIWNQLDGLKRDIACQHLLLANAQTNHPEILKKQYKTLVSQVAIIIQDYPNQEDKL